MIETCKVEDLSCKLYIPQAEIRKIVIGIHGFSSNKESAVFKPLAEMLNKKGIVLLTCDLPCHGESSKPNEVLSLKRCLDAICNIEEFAIETFHAPIAFFATSFGAYLLLLHLAEKKNVASDVILRSPAIYMDEIFEKVLLQDHGFSVNDLGSVSLGWESSNYPVVDLAFYKDLCKNRLRNMKFNFFVNVIQGQKDEVVDWKKNEEFFKDKFAGKHILFYSKNSSHRFKSPEELKWNVKIAEQVFN